MMQLAVRDSGTLGVLTLRGSFCERHADELRSRLINGIDDTQRLIVDCNQVTAVDMTCLQLLCTASGVSRTMNKDFVIRGDRRSLFRKAVGATGYANCIGADPACFQNCLWLGQ